MKVSVVMSVFNAEDFLKESIESILNQTFSDFELIIVNDGSSDNSLKIIKSFRDKRIIVISQQNKGLSKSLNRGIGLASAPYIARMDADDICYPERLQKQYDFLEQHPECVLVGTNADYIDIKGSYLYTSSNPLTSHAIKKRLPEVSFFHSSVMYRKDIWKKCGGYCEDIFHHFEDKLLWNEFARHGELQNLQEALIAYRILPFSISNADKPTIQAIMKISNKIIVSGKVEQKDIEYLRNISFVNKKKRLGNYHLQLGVIYLSQNFNRKLAWINLFKSMLFTPISLTLYFNIVLSILPKRFVLAWKKRKIMI